MCKVHTVAQFPQPRTGFNMFSLVCCQFEYKTNLSQNIKYFFQRLGKHKHMFLEHFGKYFDFHGLNILQLSSKISALLTNIATLGNFDDRPMQLSYRNCRKITTPKISI